MPGPADREWLLGTLVLQPLATYHPADPAADPAARGSAQHLRVLHRGQGIG